MGDYRQARSLAPANLVDDAVWRALIEDYLAVDKDVMTLAEDRLLPNASEGCDGGKLKWIGCGEEAPLPVPVPTRGDAFRPYRRVELLFVRADKLPCKPPPPATLGMVPTGAGMTTWCLGPGPGEPRAARCCFATRACGSASPGQWCIVPPDAATVAIAGSFVFEDGSPAPDIRFVLIAPDGEYLAGERESPPEVGEGIVARADAAGRFSFPQQKTVGVCTIEVREPFAARLAGQDATFKGNVVCARVAAGGGSIDVELTPTGPNAPPVSGIIEVQAPEAQATPDDEAPPEDPAPPGDEEPVDDEAEPVADDAPAVEPVLAAVASAATAATRTPVGPGIKPSARVVVVPKPHTSPKRVNVRLAVDRPFTGTGLLTNAAPDKVKLFLADGTQLQLDGKANLFTGKQLVAGVPLLAEAGVHSDKPDDVVLTLTLAGGSKPLGPPVTMTMTSVELTLEIRGVRPAAGDPRPLSEADKIKPGAFLAAQDAGNHQTRAMVVVRVEPATFTGALSLRRSPSSLRVALFADEVPAAGQKPLAVPHTIDPVTIQPGGRRLFVQGSAVSQASQDSGLQLGLAGGEVDGDRVAITVVAVEFTSRITAGTPVPAVATFVRMGLWDNAFRGDGVDAASPALSKDATLFNDAAEADNFVGADTRGFHLRVRDASSAGRNPGRQDRLDVSWRTLAPGRADLDKPAIPEVTLIAVTTRPGVFQSRALMLVSDLMDRDQPTHTGLPAGFFGSGEVHGRDKANHRTRLAHMAGFVRAEYPLPDGRVAVAEVPVFRRKPDERRRLPVQIFVLRVAVGGDGVVKTAPNEDLWKVDLRVMAETYARIGIQFETVVAPGTPAASIRSDGGRSVVLIDPPPGVANPLRIGDAEEGLLATAHPRLPNTISLFYVGGLTSGAGGEAAPLSMFPTAPERGTAFVIHQTGPYAATHEVGHVHSDRGHYVAPTAPVGNRLHNQQNLMKAQVLLRERLAGPKRLWVAPDGSGFSQVTFMLASKLTRPF